MAYNKDRGDSPMRRRGPRRRKKKFVHSVLTKSMITLITKMLQN